ncbi:coenzyme A disulfide reductase [compost metagenome]
MLSDSTLISVGTTIWTLGLAPNPVIRSLQLPVTPSGQAIVDESYRVRDMHGVYSIGDCANIVDPKSGAADRMTCKEAIPQANRLGSIIIDDLTGQTTPVHKALFDSFAVGLGPGRGLVWTHKWGVNVMITGKLAYKIKLYVWDFASLLK